MPQQRYRLAATVVSAWPKLGWAALVERGSSIVRVFHGPCVETARDWCAEAVWAGDYSRGDFDLTDLITGTGVRLRGQSIVFASSGDSLNRLHYCEADDKFCVSNSLALLLATADVSLCPDYDYAEAMHSVVKGLNSYERQVPSSAGSIRIAYFCNLIVGSSGISEHPKPSSAPDFNDFATYRRYLTDTAKLFGENAASSQRSHRITPIATLSKGYDSPAAAVLAREAGARDAVTITRARRMADQLLDTDDSGEAIARELDLNARCYPRYRKNYPSEDATWASEGNVGDINLTLFDYPKPLTLLFTGFMGDVLWGMDTAPQPEPLHRKDTSGARFNECRLDLGVFNCAPVFWGCRKEDQVLALSHLPEMVPWTLGNTYDRPIPRRIVEEGGGKRGSFATKKKVSSFNRRYGRPLSENLREDFSRFMRRRGGKARSGPVEKLSLLLKGLDSRIFRKLPKPFCFSAREWIALPEPSSFFLWANERRMRRFQAALERATTPSDHARTTATVEPCHLWQGDSPDIRVRNLRLK